MKYNRLGKSDLNISKLTLGTMQFGAAIDEPQAMRIMDAAFEAGINTFDTAEMYAVPPREDLQGLPERMIGDWLKSKKREDVLVASKIAGPGQMTWIPTRRVPTSPKGPTQLDRASIAAACDGCLQRLGTDYLDLFQTHWPSRYIGGLFGQMAYDRALERASIAMEEQVDAMNELVKAGKIRSWGVSNENAFGLAKIDEATRALNASPCVSIQNDFSLMERNFEPELAEACSPHNLDIGLLVYGGLCGGTLSGKYRNGAKPKGRHSDYPQFQPRYHSALSLQAAEDYAALAEENDMSPTALATAWVLQRPYVATMIIGMTQLDQLPEMLKGADLQLSDDVLQKIELIHAKNPNPNSRFDGLKK